jgi:hypothetical protein
MHRNIPFVLGAILALASPWTAAQGVWRCGNSYGQQPCAGGSVVATDRTPSAAEAAQSRRGADADAKRAGELEKARLEREKNAPAAVIPPEPKAAEAKGTAGKKKDGKSGKHAEHLTATAPLPRPEPKAKLSK